MSGARWLAQHAEDGDIVFRIGRDGDDVIAEWTGLVRLVARRDGTAWRLEVVAGADARAVEKIERGSAPLLLRHLAGRLALHGAAVSYGGRAVVLLGRSGEGKSTLAAWLCRRAEAALLADDAVAIDEEREDELVGSADRARARRWIVSATEQHHWLDDLARRAVEIDGARRHPDEATGAVGKAPHRAAHVGSGVARVRALVALSFEDVASPRLTRVRGVDAAAVLVPQVVRFVLDEPAMQRREVDELAALVESVPVFTLARRRDLGGLDATGALVKDVLLCTTEGLLT